MMRQHHPSTPTQTPVTALVADSRGEIFELEGYAAVSRSGETFRVLFVEDSEPMPYGGELMFLPDRRPVLFNLSEGIFETVEENPYEPGEPLFPVAAFNSPGWIVAGISAFEEEEGAEWLPMFSYGAVGWYGDGFRTPVILVDDEPRQDLRKMRREDVVSGISRMKKRLPGNRLRRHLQTCALEWGCPAGKNFFLSRYEAPLPTATVCNARCIGCLSFQPETDKACSQHRIAFTPSAEEIADVALTHIADVDCPVVSFGQGCEGDPLLAADASVPAISRIRKKTDKGTIHMNTNGSRPDILSRLLDAGLDSIRVSMNSVRPDCYHAYFRPRGYIFDNVRESIELALSENRFVSINYLNIPGFTDTEEEIAALIEFITSSRIHMIQWRNLNIDPNRYWDIMDAVAPLSEPKGAEAVLKRVKKARPDLIHGYFNPPKEKWRPPCAG